jgi:hypothetical protein
MRRLKVFSLAVVLALTGAGIIYGYADSKDGDLPPGFDRAHSDLTPAAAQAFSQFRLYSVGDSFEGLPLKVINRRLDPPISESHEPLVVRANFVNFIYGDCKAESDAGCVPPLEVQIWPACERNLSVYSLTPDGDPLPHENTTVRGAPAAFFEDGTRLEIYSGKETVVLFGVGRSQLRRAADALAAVNHAGPAKGDPLPPPAAGAREGKLHC